MKYLIWLICLFVRTALAVEIEATGYGQNTNEALINAKTAAIEKVVGTFVTGRTHVEDERARPHQVERDALERRLRERDVAHHAHAARGAAP